MLDVQVQFIRLTLSALLNSSDDRCLTVKLRKCNKYRCVGDRSTSTLAETGSVALRETRQSGFGGLLGLTYPYITSHDPPGRTGPSPNRVGFGATRPFFEYPASLAKTNQKALEKHFRSNLVEYF